MPLQFAVTWDYRCPFARNFHEHLVAGLEHGATWDVRCVAFSLTQNHVEAGDTSVWDEPDKDSGLLALQVGTIVRDEHPDRFPAVHRSLFALRHDEGKLLTEPDLLRAVVDRHGLDGSAIVDRAVAGEAIPTVRKDHEEAVGQGVWGVPTVLTDDAAVFIRLMDRASDDPEASVRSIERAVSLVGCWPELNEFKHVAVPR